MDLLDRLLGHDAWTTRRILDLCSDLTDEELDRDFDIGHRTLRRTLDHVIHNMESWSAAMEDAPYRRSDDITVSGMVTRLETAERRLRRISRAIAESGAWDDEWLDQLDTPPRKKSFGTAIAHVITHSMHHRAQLLYMLRLSGIRNLPEGDVFSWEEQNTA